MIAGTKELQDKLSNLRRGLHIAMDELARRDNQNRAREILAELDTHMTRLINHMKVVEAPSDR